MIVPNESNPARVNTLSEYECISNVNVPIEHSSGLMQPSMSTRWNTYPIRLERFYHFNFWDAPVNKSWQFAYTLWHVLLCLKKLLSVECFWKADFLIIKSGGRSQFKSCSLFLLTCRSMLCVQYLVWLVYVHVLYLHWNISLLFKCALIVLCFEFLCSSLIAPSHFFHKT